ncbi:hypothetical protein pipiens_013347 [Culex pipiens pipiens]|uniref:EGF-like domain-containing protein n=1 Tax=Culex pipiens pipiens TaxID=38569 RepID=A0ABD1CYR5_CULPP
MKVFALTCALLLSLPLLAVGRLCPREVRVPYVKWGNQHVSRTTPCDYVCWGKWHKIYIESGYSTNTCELAYRTETKQECCEGFEKDSRGECRPVCEGGCVGGRCVAPNRCGCEEGFRLRGNRCVPVCDPGCIFGDCTGVGVCSCLPGYRNRTATECEPVCDPPCEQGKCIAPNTCDCRHGFELAGNSKHLCKPRCDPKIAKCGNGTCVEPNRCNCEKGYEFKGHACVPICDPTCINAECSQPNTCTCKQGFSNSSEPNVCKPICDEGCSNGTCVAPNTCLCLHGYQPSEAAPNSCEPSCDPKFFDTTNGQCTAPNVLRCNEGYQLTYSVESGLIRCQSQCSPGMCQCSMSSGRLLSVFGRILSLPGSSQCV